MKFLRIRQVTQLTGLSRMTIYRLELAARFRKRRKLSQHSVAWAEAEVAAWADSRPVAHPGELCGALGYGARLVDRCTCAGEFPAYGAGLYTP